MNHPDVESQPPIFLVSTALRTLEPGIITAAGDVENIAHPAYLEYLPMIRYESKFHF
jgi:hypothetical protein